MFTVLPTKINNFDILLENTAYAQLGYQLESHGRLDKTIYDESSVKVSCKRQQWVLF